MRRLAGRAVGYGAAGCQVEETLLSAAKASCTARLLQEDLDATVPGPLFLLRLRALYLARGLQGPRIVGGAVPGQMGMHGI